MDDDKNGDHSSKAGEAGLESPSSSSAAGHGLVLEMGEAEDQGIGGSSIKKQPGSVVVEKSILELEFGKGAGEFNFKGTLGQMEGEIDELKAFVQEDKAMFSGGQPSLSQEVSHELQGKDKIPEVAVEESKKSADEAIGRKEEDVFKLTRTIQKLTLGVEGKIETVTTKEEPEDLKRDLKEAFGMPVDEGVAQIQSDSVISIIPEEIWIMIFENVSDPKDLWNLCNTCRFFDDILHQRKMGYLFKEALPSLYRHLPGNKILECRTMCKEWNAVVLNFHEDHPSLRPHAGWSDPRKIDFVNPAKEKGLCLKNAIDFITTETCVPLLEDVEFQHVFPQGQNPFIDRSVVLRIGEKLGFHGEGDESHYGYGMRREDEQPIMEQLWGRVYKFMEYFGKDIRYLNVGFTRGGGREPLRKSSQFVEDVFEKLAPNLRKLHLTSLDEHDDRIPLDPKMFPPAADLETLECSSPYADPLAVALLTRYHLQLRKVVVRNSIWNQVYQLDWHNLTELHLNAKLDAGNFDALNRNRGRMPMLTKLGIEMPSYSYSSRFFTYEKMMEMIHRLSKTTRLNTLILKGHNLMLEGGPKSAATLDYPTPSSLKTLIMHHRYVVDWKTLAPSYDVLLRCFPTIENLHVLLRMKDFHLPYVVRFDYDADFYETDLMSTKECARFISGLPPSRDKIMDLTKYMCGGEMYKSNVWKLFPQLKVFTFQSNVFTREGYEDYLRNKK